MRSSIQVKSPRWAKNVGLLQSLTRSSLLVAVTTCALSACGGGGGSGSEGPATGVSPTPTALPTATPAAVPTSSPTAVPTASPGPSLPGSETDRRVVRELTGFYTGGGPAAIIISSDGQFHAGILDRGFFGTVSGYFYDDVTRSHYFDVTGKSQFGDQPPIDFVVSRARWDGSRLDWAYTLSTGETVQRRDRDTFNEGFKDFVGEFVLDESIGEGIAFRIDGNGIVSNATLVESICNVAGRATLGLDGIYHFDINVSQCDLSGRYTGVGTSMFQERGSGSYCKAGTQFSVIWKTSDFSRLIFDDCMSPV